MTYKDAIRESMTMLAKDPLTRFCGYGLKVGRAAGSLAGAKEEQICEFTVAENLMMGAAVGMALTGLKPLVLFERADFLLNGLDAIVNHLDAAKIISRGEFNPTCIIRVVVGNLRKPLFTGHTHTRNHASALREMVSFPVWEVWTQDQVTVAYQEAYRNLGVHSTAIFELKDKY